MNRTTKEHIARELAQVAIACLSAATGGLFVDPVLAAGTGSALSRLLDRIDLGRTGKNYVETARSTLLELAARYPDEVVHPAFATALEAVKKSGLGARQFARLDFDPRRAAAAVAKASGYHNLTRQDDDGRPTLAFQCLQVLYECYRQHAKQGEELEQAFQDELLARTRDLADLAEELRPLAAALSWRSLLEMPSVQYYPDASPTTLLSPYYQILPYQSRAEDEVFEHWLEERANSPIRIATVQAGGGAGKTRWLLEHCERRNSSWRVGFLRNEDHLSSAATYKVMLNSPQKVLVVVDYVEDRPDQLTHLLDAASRALNSGARHLRIVLLSRNLTEQWWDNLRPRLPVRARGWVTRNSQVLQPFNLTPLIPAIEDRRAVFTTAADALRPPLAEPADISNPPDLARSFYGDPLFVQLAALGMLRGGVAPLNDTELLEATLDHEAKYWAGDGLLREQVEPVLAVITLWQGLAPGGLHAIIEQWANRDSLVSRADPTRLAKRLRRLYPGADQGIAPLLPDRLGETVILRALSDDPQSLVQAAFGPEIDDTHRQQAFRVLTRMPAGAQERLATVGHMLADLLREHGDAGFARRLMTQLPKYSLGLAEANEAAARMAREHLMAHPDESEDYRAEQAAVLSYHSVCLVNLGRREDALETAQEAADTYRQLAEQRPDAFLPDLAMSLNNLAAFLSELGRREDGLHAVQEAADTYRQLAEQRPDTFLPNLAASLNNLAAFLSKLGRREDALQTAQEAADNYRQLAEQRPDAFLPDLAMVLNNLANSLSALGRREEALQAAREAVRIRRKLAEQRPDAFLPDLAMSLNNLANRLSELGRREDALETAQEAADTYRQLAEQRPDAFLPNLAMSLNNLANRLSELGRREDALETAQEATDTYRQLAEQRPDAFLPDLAKSLGTLGSVLRQDGKTTEAAACFAEGIERLTPYAVQLSMAHGSLIGQLAGVYQEACQASGIKPDLDLLKPVVKILQRSTKDAEAKTEKKTVP